MPAKLLLQQIIACNQEAIAETGDLDCPRVAAMLEAALASPARHEELVLGLAEFIALTLDGAPPAIEAATPVPH